MAVKVTRAEARLEALREIGVDVSRWLEKAQEKTQGERTLSTTDLTGDQRKSRESSVRVPSDPISPSLSLPSLGQASLQSTSCHSRFGSLRGMA